MDYQLVFAFYQMVYQLVFAFYQMDYQLVFYFYQLDSRCMSNWGYQLVYQLVPKVAYG